MRRCSNWVSPIILVLALPAVGAATGIERTFDVGPGGDLRIDAEATTVEVRGGSTAGVRLELTRGNDDAAEIEADYEVDFSQSGDEVRVKIRRKNKWAAWKWSGRRSLSLDVVVPERFDANVETSGGGVEVAELVGEVKVQTSGGSLVLESIEGDVRGNTSGGSIRLDELSGPVDVRTSGGSIRIGTVAGQVNASTSGGSINVERAGGPLQVATSGGSIDIREAHGSVVASTSGGSIRAHMVEQPKADSSLTTSGGSVTVTIAESIAVNVDAEASGGQVHSDLGSSLTDGSSSRSRLAGKLNGGGPKLRLRSSGGSVRLAQT